MIAVSKNVYFNVLDDIADKYNNTVQRTIKIKPTEVMDNYYAEYNEDPSNKKDPNLKLVTMLEFLNKNIFAKGYTPNWSRRSFYY